VQFILGNIIVLLIEGSLLFLFFVYKNNEDIKVICENLEDVIEKETNKNELCENAAEEST
jgi:hypothetical protein